MRFLPAIINCILIWILSSSCISRASYTDDFSQKHPLIEIYFNDPGVNRHTDYDPEIDDRIAKLIDNAQSSVYFSFYGFKRRKIIDAVLRTIVRGLDVQFAGDLGHYRQNDIGYIEYRELMKKYPNAKMSVGNSKSIMHNKWVVIDEKFIMTGTGNITDSEIEKNNNAWVIIYSKELAKDFINEHQQMMRGRFGHAKTRQDFNNEFMVGDIKIENYFSPYEDAMSRFLQAVKEARHNIEYMIFAFTDDRLGRLLINKHQEFTSLNKDGGNRRVTGIMDKSQFVHNQYVEVYRIASSCGDPLSVINNRCSTPMDVRRDGNENTVFPGDWQAGGGRLHSKVIIIDAYTDEAKILIGSFNWSPNANNNNDENLIVIHSQQIARMFMKEFTRIYQNGLPLPGDQGKYQEAVISELNWAGTMRAICFDGSDPVSSNKISYNTTCANKYFYAYDGNEFIEIYNPNEYPLDISYWSLVSPLQDQYENPDIYYSGFPNYETVQKKAMIGFPEGTIIPPKGFFVIYEPDLRDDNQNGYSFNSAEFYDPANTSTINNKLVVYSPYNGLANFLTLYDRRGSREYRSGGFPDFEYSGFQTFCRPAYSYWITRFASSQSWNVYNINSSTNFPYKLGLWIELRDNRGNLVDINGPGRISVSPYTFEKGGFHNSSNPQDSSRIWPPPTFICGHDTITSTFTQNASTDNPSNYYMVSMERKLPINGQWLDGTKWSSWDHAKIAGKYIDESFTDRTRATPGEKNSNW